MSWETKSCTVFDITGLTEVKGKRTRDWVPLFYFNDYNECVARTCGACKTILPSDMFSPATKGGSYGLQSVCRSCKNRRARESNSQSIEGLRPSTIRSRKYILNYKNRTDAQILIDRNRLRPSGEKKCRSCSISMPLTNFYTNKRFPDGLAGECKRCSTDRCVNIRRNNVIPYWVSQDIILECYICAAPWEHADHVIPRSLGGTDECYNMLPMCANHNIGKKDKPLREWLKENHPDKYDEVIHRVTVEYGMEIDPTLFDR